MFYKSTYNSNLLSSLIYDQKRIILCSFQVERKNNSKNWNQKTEEEVWKKKWKQKQKEKKKRKKNKFLYWFLQA